MTPKSSLRPARPAARLGFLAPALLLGLVLGGCRGCSGGSGGKLEEKAPTAKKEKRPEGPTVRDSLKRQGPLQSLAMQVPTAAEPERTLAEPVQQAKELVEKGEAGAATEARSLLSQWIAENPTDADAYYWMGRSWMAERIKVQAVEPYQRALEHDPELISAHRWIAYVLHAENRCEEAVVHLDAALVALPDDPGVHIDRAVCASALQQWDILAERLRSACDLGHTEICETAALAERMAERRKNLSELKAKRGKVGKGKGKMRAGKAKGGFRGGGLMGKGGKFGKLGGGSRGADPTEGTDDDAGTTDGTNEGTTTDE